MRDASLWLALATSLSACVPHAPPTPVVEVVQAAAAPALPASLVGKAVVLDPTSPEYARAALSEAVKPAGQGGLVEGFAIQLTSDVPVYRMWSGPEKKDARGNTNRIGQWWSSDAPSGPVAGYRADYEICAAWNDLTWAATCTLKAGSVVAVGPGQSVSGETCGDPAESYPANQEDWQLYVSKAWTELGAELDCPPETADRLVDPAEISR